MCLSLAIALTALTGCSDEASGPGAKDPGAPPAARPEARAKAFDPPATFGEAVELPRDESVKSWGFAQSGPVLYERTAKALDAYDTASGRRLWSSDLGRKDWYTGTEGGLDDDQRIPPVFAREGERTQVLFAFSDYTKGSGTEVDRTDVHLRAVDAGSGKVSWTTRLPAPTGTDVSDLEPAVVGTEDGTAVVRVLTSADESSEDSESAVTYAVDLSTRQVSWTQEGFAATAVDGGVVVGAQVSDSAWFRPLDGWHADEEDLALSGRAVADGAVLWTEAGRSSVDVESVGGGFFLAGSLRDSRTGKAVPGTGDSYLRCFYDQRSVVVCGGKETVRGVDTRSHEVLWTISGDDPSRKMPEVAAAWHGAVYAGTGPGNVVLDARTGKDRSVFDGVNPFTVNEYAAVDIDMVVHPATG